MNYFIVELITPVVWMLIFWHAHHEFNIIFLKYIILFSAGIIIFFIDLYHKIIPDVINLPLLIIGLIIALFPQTDISFWKALTGAAAGFFFFYLLAMAVSYSLKKEALGGGDIKFIATIGSFLGVYGTLFTIFISAAIAIVVVLISGRDRSQEIPYGPFLILGAFIHVLFGNWLLSSYLHLFY